MSAARTAFSGGSDTGLDDGVCRRELQPGTSVHITMDVKGPDRD